MEEFILDMLLARRGGGFEIEFILGKGHMRDVYLCSSTV